MTKISKKAIIPVLLFCILLGSFANISTKAYVTEIKVTGKTIVIDITKFPEHTEFANFEGNLTSALNTVSIQSAFLDLSAADALFISQPKSTYTTQEMIDIGDFLASGNKCLFIGGDSDYAGFFVPTYANALLESLGSKIRFDSTSIDDIVYNDGMSYRVAAVNYSSGIIGANVSQNCAAGIVMHGPCSILGYNDSKVLDLRNNTLEGVEVLLSYSVNATSNDADGSATDYDVYSLDNQTLFEHGNYPAVVCETLIFDGNKSYIILAGEVIFADYKQQYDQYTPAGTYNGGIHYGQMFVDNMINYFLDDLNYVIIDEFSKIHLLNLVTLVPIVACIAIILKRKKSL